MINDNDFEYLEFVSLGIPSYLHDAGIPIVATDVARGMLIECKALDSNTNVQLLIHWIAVTAHELRLQAEVQAAGPERARAEKTFLLALARDPARTLGAVPPVMRHLLLPLQAVAEKEGVDLESRAGAVWAGDYASREIARQGRPGRPPDLMYAILIDRFVQIATQLKIDNSLGQKERLGDYDNGSFPAPPALRFLQLFVSAACDSALARVEPSAAVFVRAVRNKSLRTHRDAVSGARANNPYFTW